jgi:hypothetical protein
VPKDLNGNILIRVSYYRIWVSVCESGESKGKAKAVNSIEENSDSEWDISWW